MCGISVIIALQEASQNTRQPLRPTISDSTNLQHDPHAAELTNELNESLDLVAHRGPDSRGQWISSDKRVGPRPTPFS